MPKWKKPKDPEVWLALGDRCKIAKETMSPVDYVAFLRAQKELWNENTGKPCKDCINMAQRIINISQHPILRANRGKLPWYGWGGLRQLTCISDAKLSYLFANGLINRRTTRTQLDAYRTMEREGNIAPRHPPKKKGGPRDRPAPNVTPD